jgi:uncharacterized RDD family membrane protein YckC
VVSVARPNIESRSTAQTLVEFVARGLALIIDMLLLTAAAFVAASAITLFEGYVMPARAAGAALVLAWLPYTVSMLHFTGGRTFGKRILGLVVQTRTGEKSDLMALIRREALRLVMHLSPFWPLDYGWAIRRRRTLHDLVGSTSVVCIGGRRVGRGLLVVSGLFLLCFALVSVPGRLAS